MGNGTPEIVEISEIFAQTFESLISTTLTRYFYFPKKNKKNWYFENFDHPESSEAPTSTPEVVKNDDFLGGLISIFFVENYFWGDIFFVFYPYFTQFGSC